MQQDKWSRVEYWFGTLVFLLSSLFVMLLFVARWPEWWAWTVPEESPLTWMQSILLFANVLLAVSLAICVYIRHETTEFRWWMLMAFGFFFLMLDERFALHERIRDLYLAPHHITFPLFFWVKAGDFLLLIYVIIGLFISYRYLALLKVRRASFYWFLIGVVFSIVSVTMDSFDYSMYSRLAQNVQQFTEECLEIIAVNSFLVSLFLLLTYHIQQKPKLPASHT